MAKAKGKEKLPTSNVPEKVEEVTVEDVIPEPAPETEKTEVEEMTVDEDISADVEEPEEAEKPENDKEVNGDGEAEDVMTTVTPGDETADAMTTVAPGDETVEVGDIKEEAKNETAKQASNKRGKRNRKRKRAAGAASASATDKLEVPDAEKKGLKKAKGTGLIFMCSAKTKKDCFQYNVFGLPESKKELVAQINEGMRLFLYDIDLKVMHGIYEAASPGGYNIEPKAFNAAFPSQVRFTVVSDCKPLSQEQFKVAIKANYFGRNKFNTQLSEDQVNDLCKLFTSEHKPQEDNPGTGASEAATSEGRGKKGNNDKSGGRDRKGKDDKSGGRDRKGKDSKSRGRDRKGIEPNSGGRDRTRRPSFQRSAPYYPRGPTYPARGSYAPPAAHYPPVPPAYGYGAPDAYYYRGEPREPVGYREPYSMYREPAPYPSSYPDAGYPYATSHYPY